MYVDIIQLDYIDYIDCFKKTIFNINGKKETSYAFKINYSNNFIKDSFFQLFLLPLSYSKGIKPISRLLIMTRKWN